MQLLFESSPAILCVRDNLVFDVRKPDVTQAPVLVGDSFVDRRGVKMYGSVLHDQGMYRLWYGAMADNQFGEAFDSCLVGYAESDDGVTWRKPSLGLVDVGGKDNNLCDLCMGSPSVSIDPDAPPERRYVATGHIEQRYKGYHRDAQPNYRGYFTAHSADGLHWELDCDPQGRWRGGDDIATFYHPGRGQVQTLLKRLGYRAGIMKRMWWETRRERGEWAEPVMAIVPDEFTDLAAQARGAHFGDYNSFGFLDAGRATVAFAETHRSRLPLRDHPRGKGYGALGNLDITLMYQHDAGHAWLHPAGRPDFITRGCAPWAMQTMFCAYNVITIGDEQRLYLTGRNYRHGVGAAAQNNSVYVSDFGDKVGYAHWPKWRIFACRAEPEGVIDINLGHVATPGALHLNYACDPGGSVKLQWLTRREFERPQDSKPLDAPEINLDGDHLDRAVKLPVEPPRDADLAVRLTVNRATLYAYDFNAQ